MSLTDKKSERKREFEDLLGMVERALDHIPVGHQLDLAYEIVEVHKPGSPEFDPFIPDRGELMLWATSQPATYVAMMLEECLLELGTRNVSEKIYKRLIKIGWDAMSDASQASFIEWAQQETKR